MAEGVLFVGGASRQFEPDKRHQTACGVGQIVDAVGEDRNALEKPSCDNFGGAEQSVAQDADNAGQLAVALPHLMIFDLVAVLDKQPDQQ